MEIYIPISLLWLPWLITIGSLVYFRATTKPGQYDGGVAGLLFWLITVVVTWSAYHLIKLIVWAFS